MTERHIVAIGGDGLLADDRMFERYVFELTGKPEPRLLYVPTATGDRSESLEAAGERFPDATALRLFWRNEDRVDPREVILGHDVILVGGGNTANMLAVWRVHRFDRVLREAWESGVVLAGWSAGMICWFEAGVTDSFGPQLEGMRDGLGFLAGSGCPHYDGEERRRPVYRRLVAGGFPPGIALDDAAGAHYIGTELHAVVASTATAAGYRVTAAGEERLEPTRL